jgi:hypothetical protein
VWSYQMHCNLLYLSGEKLAFMLPRLVLG